ncbi:hypothetical protein AMECASPLE_013879 [Ameca splendens]|uniref:Uncharacterized protein n=1 Tax=Ameca splendens TaxID=208324 RepID=A0ABV0ZAB8_9TELE
MFLQPIAHIMDCVFFYLKEKSRPRYFSIAEWVTVSLGSAVFKVTLLTLGCLPIHLNLSSETGHMSPPSVMFSFCISHLHSLPLHVFPLYLIFSEEFIGSS